ncbi:hypothetical protein MRX96_009033 [Rhipicephalus microplus]
MDPGDVLLICYDDDSGNGQSVDVHDVPPHLGKTLDRRHSDVLQMVGCRWVTEVDIGRKLYFLDVTRGVLVRDGHCFC